eukprot:scaffold520833_cov28-Prasinocladus_malaysianus.AAC.1
MEKYKIVKSRRKTACGFPGNRGKDESKYHVSALGSYKFCSAWKVLYVEGRVPCNPQALKSLQFSNSSRWGMSLTRTHNNMQKMGFLKLHPYDRTFYRNAEAG